LKQKQIFSFSSVSLDWTVRDGRMQPIFCSRRCRTGKSTAIS